MKKTRSKESEEIEFQAIKIVPGLAIGPAFPFKRMIFKLDDFNYKIEDIAHEIKLFDEACQETIRQLSKTKESSSIKKNSQLLSMFDSQIAILNDQDLQKEIKDIIRSKSRSAAYAVITVLQNKKEYFLNLTNEYFRDRAFDMLDLKNRLLNTLAGVSTDYSVDIPSVIFSDDLMPADTVHFKRKSILGFVTDTGGRTSHAAIMAKSLHIPYVVNNFSLSKLIQKDDFIIVDGFQGKIIINPERDTINRYNLLKKKSDKTYGKLRKEASKPAITKDGTPITVMANLDFSEELNEALEYGANGIGLLRTEVLFIEKEKIPSEDEQCDIYSDFARRMSEYPVYIRTIDVGGDKILPELQDSSEQNPILGWRAIRFCLDEPEIFKTQLRAILRSNFNGNVRILIPMISSFSEIEKTKEILGEARQELNREKIKYNPDIKIGIMIETPSAAIMANEFSKEVDFLSIGSNDLTQYTLAVDRTNNKVSKLFDDMHPAVLRLIESTVKVGEKNNIEISICGEMAGNPESTALLLGLGIRTLSISPGQIPVIKKIIKLLTINECENLVEIIRTKNRHEDIDLEVNKFILDKYADLELLN
jgi:phosphotransferase system enzyme I (PtsI)